MDGQQPPVSPTPPNDPYGWSRFRVTGEQIHTPPTQSEPVSRPVPPPPPPPVQTAPPRQRRRPSRFLGLLCMMLAVAALSSAGTYYWLRRSMNDTIDQAVARAINHLSLQPSGTSIDQPLITGLEDVIELASEGVVAITASSGSGAGFGGSSATSAGSGVIIRSDGIIVTCEHVISDATKITVYLKNGQEYPATLVGSDEKTDLAVLKIDAQNLIPVAIGDSSGLRLGTPVYAIGNPLGELNGSVTGGMISAIDRSIQIGSYSMTVLQTDAAINSGNSGGALLNAQGQLIGIVNAKSFGLSVEGLGFAIPFHKASGTIEQLLTYGYVKDRPYIGISMQQITSDRMGKAVGVYIVQVFKDTAADQAGVQIGDRIVSIDGKNIMKLEDIDSLLESFTVGQKITMVVERSGAQHTLSLTLTDSSKKNAN